MSGPTGREPYSVGDEAAGGDRIPGPLDGDYANEMEHFEITPDEAEQLLSGRAFARDDLAELTDFVRSAASTTHERPSPQTEQRHLAAIVEATHLEPLATAPRAGSTTMASILRSKVFRALAGAAAAVLAMGGLAAAQTLPAPAQDAMAEVAERVGITLPHSAEHEAKTKRGADHDGDGVADDNGLHTGQTGEKRGADHDGDGVADDNGRHKGQNSDDTTDDDTTDKTKRGSDHDGDGVADDNGLRKGENKAGDPDENDDGPGQKEKVKDKVKENQGRGRGSDGDKADRDSDDEPKTGRGSNDD